MHWLFSSMDKHIINDWLPGAGNRRTAMIVDMVAANELKGSDSLLNVPQASRFNTLELKLLILLFFNRYLALKKLDSVSLCRQGIDGYKIPYTNDGKSQDKRTVRKKYASIRLGTVPLGKMRGLHEILFQLKKSF